MGHSERDCNIVYANSDKVIERAYGTWLRAPLKNVKMNMGSRLLRNPNNGEGQWAQKEKQGEIETIVHGGGRTEERFMEVDGVFRVNLGDVETIKIMQRDMGDIAKLIQLQNQRKDNEAGNSNSNEKIMIYPKRRRVNIEIDGENKGEDI